MADHLQEQADELEALQAIFPDEYQSMGAGVAFSHKLSIVPNQSGDDNHVAVNLLFTFPPDYPTVIPEYDIELVKGLNSKHKEELTALVEQQANDNLGMPCIYAIAEAVRSWLQDNNIAGQDGSMYADMMRRMQQKTIEGKKKAEKAAVVAAAQAEVFARTPQIDKEEEERIRKRQAGTPVTVESFLVWKKKFDAERAAESMAKAGSAAASVASGVDSKPTGKQLFLSNRAGLEEALIALTEKDDRATEEIAEAMRRARLSKAAGGRDQEASAGGAGVDEEVDFDESLYLQEGMDDELDDDEDFDPDELDDEDLEDDEDDEDYELEEEN